MTLQDKGNAGGLKGSISTDYDASRAMVGTNKVYGPIHQFGVEAGRNHSVELEARPYLPLTGDGELQPEAETSVLDTIVRHLESAAHR